MPKVHEMEERPITNVSDVGWPPSAGDETFAELKARPMMAFGQYM